MQKRNLEWLVVIGTLLFVSLACSIPQTAKDGTLNVETQVALTVAAELTRAAQLTVSAPISPSQMPTQAVSVTSAPTAVNASTPEPSQTPIPVYTPTQTVSPTISLTPSITPTITNTPIPCNWAKFVEDVSFPDGSEIAVNTDFVKTWRLKNIGSCTWNSSYRLIFASGNQMGAPASISLTPGTVAPGGSVNISIPLTAPGSAGSYEGSFLLQAPDGTVFGIGEHADGKFWVKITTTVPLPDLYISKFSLDPNPPVMGSSTHVEITVYNRGNANAGPFSVEWKGGENFSGPSCLWDLSLLVPSGGRVLECDFTYGSWYSKITTKVVADVDDEVTESDEGNNVFEKNISVKKP